MKLQAECDNSRIVHLSVRRALLAAAFAVAATQSPASFAAAPAADAELEEVVVTGSILRRTDTETPSPVTVLSAETLEQRGLNTAAEAIQRLPMNNAGTMTSGWAGNNFASGAIAPALRGLTVQATLSMADGMRLAPYPLTDDGHRNFVDLSTIPNAIIDRIEVLQDGASSTYGSDAIAGVINVITKKEIQGFLINGSYGVDQRGDAPERRFDITYGLGDLASDGFNFYVSAEYQKQDELMARDRGYPFNTFDWSGRCGDAGSCMPNLNFNGVTPETGAINGISTIPGVTLVQRLYTPGTTSNPSTQPVIRYEFLNPTAGCREWQSYNLTTAQLAALPTAPSRLCEVNYHGAYEMIQPEIERMGLSSRFTGRIGDNTEVFASAGYYKTHTFAQIAPRSFSGTPPPPNPAGLAAYNLILPVYVCAAGVGTPNGTNTGCTSANGTLNPYNPYAGAGFTARALLRSPFPWTDEANSHTLRGQVGVEGTFAADEGTRYKADFSLSEVNLTRSQENYLNPQRIMDVAARGTFNFANPLQTPQDVWDYISPPSEVTSTSKLWQLQGTLARDLMSLAGGPLQAAIGASYREESVNAPSANPGNPVRPYDRYFTINAVGAKGTRNVKSGFFELNAPVLEQLELVGTGRYDKYSSGQSNFSPKIGFKFKPLEQLAVRGTWSKGFRVPSFNEAYGVPTTGYVTSTINCTTFAAFCAAHNANAYATNQYSIGLTNSGNPNLKPEKSKSFTFGFVAEPLDNVSVTLDYWNIKVKDLIKGVTASQSLIAQYYSSGGTSSTPGVTFAPGNPDLAFPNALPLLGFIQASFQNIDSQKASGIDLGAKLNLPLGGGFMFYSSVDAAYLLDLTQNVGGTPEHYDGTLSPCDVTSCSGAPKWRGTWQNTVEYGDMAASLTTYYTGGYDTASVDYGGVKGACQDNTDNATSTAAYVNGDPVNCKQGATWNVDLTLRYRISDKVTIQGDVLNVLDLPAPFDPSAAYGLYGYNPAWAGPNIMGRYFRLGAKLKL